MMIVFFRFCLRLVRSNVNVRIFLIITLMVLVPSTILFVGSVAFFEKAVREALNTELSTALDGSERDVTSFLANLVAVSGVITNDPMIRRAIDEPMEDVERTRVIDRAIAGLLTPLPGNDTIQYTLITPKGLFSSWSRNFNDYSFLSDLPVVRKAQVASGHVVWEGFAPSFVLEEQHFLHFVSLGRAFGSSVIILSAGKDSFRRYLMDKRPGSSYTTLLVSGAGEIYMEAGDHPLPHTILEKTAQLAASPPGTRSSSGIRIGDYLVAGRKLDGLPPDLLAQDWSINVLYSYGNVSRRFNNIRSSFIPTFLVLFLLVLITVFFVSRKVVNPIVSLSRVMEKWNPETSGNAKPMDLQRADEIGNLNRSFTRLQENMQALIEGIRREHSARDLYRYRALRSQLNPHFLFNSLNSIRWLAIIRKADNIVTAIDDLSNILSYSMAKDGDLSTLGLELESVQHYLAIQNLRYGGRFILRTVVPPELLAAGVLKFMLQPIVENCVVHGYRDATGEGIIDIEASPDGNMLVISVSDRGTGLGTGSGTSPGFFSLESGAENEKERNRDSGIGLRNIRDMIALSAGQTGTDTAGDLSIAERDGGGTVVTIRLPLIMRQSVNGAEA